MTSCTPRLRLPFPSRTDLVSGAPGGGLALWRSPPHGGGPGWGARSTLKQAEANSTPRGKSPAAFVGTRGGPMPQRSHHEADEAADCRRDRLGTGGPVRVKLMTRGVLFLAAMAAAAVAYVAGGPDGSE